jgi:hypothetical protein
MMGIDNKVLVFSLTFVVAMFFYVYFFVFPLMSKVSDFEFSRESMCVVEKTYA